MPLPVTPAGDGAAPAQDGATEVETTEVAGEEPRATRRTALVAAGLVALLVVVALVVWLATRGTEPTTTTPGPSPSASSPPRLRHGHRQHHDEPQPHRVGHGVGLGDVVRQRDDHRRPGRPGPDHHPRRPHPARRGRGGLDLPRAGATRRAGRRSPRRGRATSAGSRSNGPEDSRNQSLLVFPTEDAAVAYLATMQAAAEACAGPGDGLTDTPAVVVQTVDGDWDSSLMVVLSYPVPEGGYSPGGDYTLAARTGSAVAVSGGYAEWPPGYPTPAPAAVADVPRRARRARPAALRLHRRRLLTPHLEGGTQPITVPDEAALRSRSREKEPRSITLPV